MSTSLKHNRSNFDERECFIFAVTVRKGSPYAERVGWLFSSVLGAGLESENDPDEDCSEWDVRIDVSVDATSGNVSPTIYRAVLQALDDGYSREAMEILAGKHRG